MWWPFRRRPYRYEGIIVGNHSGHVTSLRFARFHTAREAEAWLSMVTMTPNPVTRYELRPIPVGDPREYMKGDVT
jgi:hypothetical protein